MKKNSKGSAAPKKQQRGRKERREEIGRSKLSKP